MILIIVIEKPIGAGAIPGAGPPPDLLIGGIIEPAAGKVAGGGPADIVEPDILGAIGQRRTGIGPEGHGLSPGHEPRGPHRHRVGAAGGPLHRPGARNIIEFKRDLVYGGTGSAYLQIKYGG